MQRKGRGGNPWSTPCLKKRTMAGENNEGAYGEFTFNVPARSITLDYNERYEDSHYTQHNF